MVGSGSEWHLSWGTIQRGCVRENGLGILLVAESQNLFRGWPSFWWEAASLLQFCLELPRTLHGAGLQFSNCFFKAYCPPGHQVSEALAPAPKEHIRIPKRVGMGRKKEYAHSYNP